MRTLLSAISGAPVLSHESRTRIGTIADVLIDPKTLRIEGFYIAIPQFIRSIFRFILSNDIARIGTTVVVRSEDMLCDIDDIFRLQPIILKHTPILHARVFTSDALYLGKVFDVQFDTETLSVTQILIKKLFSSIRIIPIQQIKTVNQNGIWLKNTNQKAITLDLTESSSTILQQLQEI